MTLRKSDFLGPSFLISHKDMIKGKEFLAPFPHFIHLLLGPQPHNPVICVSIWVISLGFDNNITWEIHCHQEVLGSSMLGKMDNADLFKKLLMEQDLV